ncbi:MAG: tetratricopeptide repeat protein [Bacteroidales bacterium]|nr:tetratricopeptide repeat protein [Bacteroidales bacterium]
MKKTILILVFPLLCNTLFGQQKEEAEKLVEEGIVYHDKGDYESAIDKYNKALELDKDNLFALAEKAASLFYLQKYDEAIENCERAIEKHQGEEALKLVYVTCGNTYDALKETSKSLDVYDEGLKLFPDFFLLHFNKGITLLNIERYDEAIICFQKSVSLNPQHASSQNALGRLLYVTEKRIPAILALSRFLILEPQTKRAKGNLELLQSIMKANVEKTGKNTINININPDMLGDTTADGRPNENSFAITDLILSMDAAYDYSKENKKKTEVEKFIRKFETICNSLKEAQDKNYGFYWDYYVPYFVEMKDKNFIETFAYIAFATSDYPDVNKWLKKHKKDINSFYEWSSNFAWKTNN